IDELAHRKGQDPYQYRRELLAKSPRALAVLDLAAEKSGWKNPPPPGHYRGIAFSEAFLTVIAHVVELSVAADGGIKIHRVVAGVDSGTILDRGITANSIEGGTAWGLSCAEKAEITFDRGRVVQGNWNDYEVLRMSQMPAVEVHFIDSGARPLGGTGEVGPVTAIPALTNAIFAASGPRIRSLPLSPHCLRITWRRPRSFEMCLPVIALASVAVSMLVSQVASTSMPTQVAPEIPRGKGYFVTEIRDGLYWLTDGAYGTIFLVHSKGVIAVDPLPTLGPRYLKAIAEVTDKPVTHVIYSHEHTDHIGAADLFPNTAIFIAHKETAAILARRKDPRRPLPQVTFEKSYTLRSGGQTLILEYKGINHELGNIFIHAPRQKVLMLVDVVYPGFMPYKNLGIAEDFPGYIRAHADALTYDFDVFVGGHVSRLGTRKDVEVA